MNEIVIFISYTTSKKAMLLLVTRVFIDVFLADFIGHLLILLLIFHMASAEEKSIWENVIQADIYASEGFNGSYSPAINLIRGSFKEIVHTDSRESDQWIRIDQGKPTKLSRIYIQNRSDGSWKRFANLYFCMGNDPSQPDAPGNTCSVPIHEGGFIDVESLPAGRYLFIHRKDKNRPINIATVRAFQSTNLLDPEYGAKIINDYIPVVG